MNSIKELMILYGYRFTGTCHCDGYTTEKYRNGDYELRWRKAKYQFRIKRNNRELMQWQPLTKLEQELKNIHAEVA